MEVHGSGRGDDWIGTIRACVRDADVDFFRIRPGRYWTDFFISITLAYTAAAIYLQARPFSGLQGVAFAVAVFWLYRLGSLVHEVAHLGHKEMRLYKVTWNLLAGVITLTPSPFFTRHHRDHHTCRMYGTRQDPEYVVNICHPGSWKSLLGYLIRILLFPILVFLRFFLAPLTFLRPGIRQWVVRRASALTMNWHYERHASPSEMRALTAVEGLCWLRASMIPSVILLGLAPWYRIPLLYALAAGVLVLNQLRQLADHHFASQGDKLTIEDHILDSCNHTGKDVITWLLFPFTIRYHALHHVFPSLPYHNLPRTHAHLLACLPADSPYRQLDQPSWWQAARRIFVTDSAVSVSAQGHSVT